MTIGFNKQLQVFASVQKTLAFLRSLASLGCALGRPPAGGCASQCAHWRTPGWPLLPRTQLPFSYVIANQSADWCGNPSPLTQSVFSEILRNLQRFRCGLPRRFAPRNDSAGQNPVIKMFMLTKTDRHNVLFSYSPSGLSSVGASSSAGGSCCLLALT